jgi:NAD(P)-dependent dehydrogenase (short-subunit alcohol dehydrogenase family)
MQFNINQNKPVIALLGAGAMGTAIVKRIAAGKVILIGDISEKNLEAKAAELRMQGLDVETQNVDATDRNSIRAFAQRAAELGEVKYFIDTAGASPNQSSPEHIIRLDLMGTSYAIDEFAKVIATWRCWYRHLKSDWIYDALHFRSGTSISYRTDR